MFAYNVSHPDFRAKLRNEAITKTKLSREIADAISSTVSGWIRDYDALRTRCEDYNADLGTAACAVLNDAYRLNIPLQQNELQRMRLPIIANTQIGYVDSRVVHAGGPVSTTVSYDRANRGAPRYQNGKPVKCLQTDGDSVTRYIPNQLSIMPAPAAASTDTSVSVSGEKRVLTLDEELEDDMPLKKRKSRAKPILPAPTEHKKTPISPENETFPLPPNDPLYKYAMSITMLKTVDRIKSNPDERERGEQLDQFFKDITAGIKQLLRKSEMSEVQRIKNDISPLSAGDRVRLRILQSLK